MICDIEELTCEGGHPKDVIILGRTEDGGASRVIYFTAEGDFKDHIRTLGGKTIIANGSQIDTIYSCLKAGHGFRHGLRTLPFGAGETPRISGLMHENGSFELSVIKEEDGAVCRYVFSFENVRPGTGRLIGTAGAAFGEPAAVRVYGTPDEYAGYILNGLCAGGEAQLYVCDADPHSGVRTQRVFGKSDIKTV
ncbi:MAG: IMP cyclohydrolase [Oscillospiraceae bacterium]